jgi:hypothetical protein
LLAFTCAIVYPAGATLGAAGVLGLTDGATDAGALTLGLVEGLTVGFALALTATPLFQINLPLFFMQVNCLPAAILFAPAFLHVAPAFTEADELGATTTDRTNAIIASIKPFLMP